MRNLSRNVDHVAVELRHTGRQLLKGLRHLPKSGLKAP